MPQTFSQHTSWPVDTNKDEDGKVGMQTHDVHIILLVTENTSTIKTGHIQNNFLIWVRNSQEKWWLDIFNMWMLVPFKLCKQLTLSYLGIPI